MTKSLDQLFNTAMLKTKNYLTAEIKPLELISEERGRKVIVFSLSNPCIRAIGVEIHTDGEMVLNNEAVICFDYFEDDYTHYLILPMKK